MQKRIISISDHARERSHSTVENDSSGEFRTAVRYNLALRVMFRWMDSGLIRRGEGTTRDVSVRSAYIIAAICPPHGAKIEMKMGLLEGRRARHAAWLDAEGAVSRIESASRPGREGGFVVESAGARFFRP